MILKFKTNINCANCLKTVSPFLNDIQDVKWSVDTTVSEKILTIEGENPDKDQVIEAVENAGFDIEEIVD
jgi:copper chaperone CopZ